MYLAKDIKDYMGHGCSFTKFGKKIKLSAPQQPNGSDCGIFVVNFMEWCDLSWFT